LNCGVPIDISEDDRFLGMINSQFIESVGNRNRGVRLPDFTYINVKNGVLKFDRQGANLEPHSSKYFVRYCLDFDYNTEATAPRWQSHLNRSLPNDEVRNYLGECLALPFYDGKIEKVLILFGEPKTGKSVTLDVYKALLGRENITSESLAALTQTGGTGDYARARLDGKLVNIASDVSKKIGDDGIAKTLISREAVSARNPYEKGFDLENGPRLVFSMNDIPPHLVSDDALCRRAAIIEFTEKVKPEESDTDFAVRIIKNELAGVLNFIIEGLNRLIKNKELKEPEWCKNSVEEIRNEIDPVRAWILERGYEVGENVGYSLSREYQGFVEFCRGNGNIPPGKNTFSSRLKSNGFNVDRPNNREGRLIYIESPLKVSNINGVYFDSPPTILKGGSKIHKN